jgi:hypothetical protein
MYIRRNIADNPGQIQCLFDLENNKKYEYKIKQNIDERKETTKTIHTCIYIHVWILSKAERKRRQKTTQKPKNKENHSTKRDYITMSPRLHQ